MPDFVEVASNTQRVMSNLCKRLAKKKPVCARKRRQEIYRHCSKLYTRFSVYSPSGKNVEVSTLQPMTEVEAQSRYGWLSVKGIEIN